MKTRVLEVNQPIGTFYLGVLPAKTVISIAKVNRREYDPQSVQTTGGPQRDLVTTRTIEIARYCSDPDATFPTPIIIAVDEDAGSVLDGDTFEFDDSRPLGDVLDGQHRLGGLSKTGELIAAFSLPVVFMFDLTPEEKAYVFSIINSKQARVPMSLIYDLFDLSTSRSPEKTCHDLARLLNSDERSPFYRRLKMLGKKKDDLASLSQGSFVKYMKPLITGDSDDDRIRLKSGREIGPDPQRPLRQYFIDKEDDTLYRIVLNLFSAVRNVFKEEWENPQTFILSKTVGFGAVLRAFKPIYDEGISRKELTVDFFQKVFSRLSDTLSRQGIRLTSDAFPSNEQGLKKLATLIEEAVADL